MSDNDDKPEQTEAPASQQNFPPGANGINLQVSENCDHMLITMFLNGQMHGWVEYSTEQLDVLISDLLAKRSQMRLGNPN